jgi:hypothetical protein
VQFYVCTDRILAVLRCVHCSCSKLAVHYWLLVATGMVVGLHYLTHTELMRVVSTLIISEMSLMRYCTIVLLVLSLLVLLLQGSYCYSSATAAASTTDTNTPNVRIHCDARALLLHVHTCVHMRICSNVSSTLSL